MRPQDNPFVYRSHGVKRAQELAAEQRVQAHDTVENAFASVLDTRTGHDTATVGVQESFTIHEKGYNRRITRQVARGKDSENRSFVIGQPVRRVESADDPRIVDAEIPRAFTLDVYEADGELSLHVRLDQHGLSVNGFDMFDDDSVLGYGGDIARVADEAADFIRSLADDDSDIRWYTETDFTLASNRALLSDDRFVEETEMFNYEAGPLTIRTPQYPLVETVLGDGGD